MHPMNSRTLYALCAALLLALPVVAHAGRDEAETALTRASSGVAAAERAGAAQSSPAAAGTAREQLGLAQRACERREWDDCERAAFRSHADARLAEAHTRQVSAEAATASLRAAVETLRAELARSGAPS
jgi:hypothetical protein